MKRQKHSQSDCTILEYNNHNNLTSERSYYKISNKSILPFTTLKEQSENIIKKADEFLRQLFYNYNYNIIF
jgi:hypothetical protein